MSQELAIVAFDSLSSVARGTCSELRRTHPAAGPPPSCAAGTAVHSPHRSPDSRTASCAPPAAAASRTGPSSEGRWPPRQRRIRCLPPFGHDPSPQVRTPGARSDKWDRNTRRISTTTICQDRSKRTNSALRFADRTDRCSVDALWLAQKARWSCMRTGTRSGVLLPDSAHRPLAARFR
jgi:hypothetical protein